MVSVWVHYFSSHNGSWVSVARLTFNWYLRRFLMLRPLHSWTKGYYNHAIVWMKSFINLECYCPKTEHFFLSISLCYIQKKDLCTNVTLIQMRDDDENDDVNRWCSVTGENNCSTTFFPVLIGICSICEYLNQVWVYILKGNYERSLRFMFP